MTNAIYDALGIDESDTWQSLALCAGMDTELFYDQYESSPRQAKLVDDICLSCPVRALCLQAGVEGGEWGVWGGVFLASGKADSNRNGHKTPEVWKRIREAL